jgi:pimeloyl-ACP methyl ester carboxylesterase
VLLHGFPSSSFMYRNLIPLLADRYRVIAPGYLGFGLSDAPPVTEFDYSFDALTDLTAGLLDQLAITRYAMYVQDYGAPIGWRPPMRQAPLARLPVMAVDLFAPRGVGSAGEFRVARVGGGRSAVQPVGGRRRVAGG